MTFQDKIAAAVIAVVNAIIPFLVVIHVLHWDGDQVAAFMLVTTTLVTLGGLIFQAQKPTPAP